METSSSSSILPSSRPQPRSSSASQQFGSSISVVQTSSLPNRTNLISVPIQEGKVNMPQAGASSTTISQSMLTHHASEALAASAYYSTSLQSYVSAAGGTYSAPNLQTVMTQNYGTIPSTLHATHSTQNPSIMSGVGQQQSGVHGLQIAPPAAHLNSRPGVPPPPAPPQAPAYYAAYGQQQYGQMPHYQYDQNNYPGNAQNQQWNQQQYYR